MKSQLSSNWPVVLVRGYIVWHRKRWTLGVGTNMHLCRKHMPSFRQTALSRCRGALLRRLKKKIADMPTASCPRAKTPRHIHAALWISKSPHGYRQCCACSLREKRNRPRAKTKNYQDKLFPSQLPCETRQQQQRLSKKEKRKT